MSENLSYQNDPALKARFIGHVEAHREHDSVRQGTYGKTERGQWKGCAIACSMRSLDEIDGLPPKTEYNEHGRLSARLNLPLTLCYLEDRIFEGLPHELALHWPTRFARAIPVGRDLSGVWDRFALWMLVDPERGVIRFANTDQTRDAICAVADLYGRKIAGDVLPADAWRSAAAAAADAAAARWAAAADDRSEHYQAAADKLIQLLEAA